MGKKQELAFISVIGKDRKGIVATISGYLYKSSINIEDITQKIMEGNFVMVMLVDIKDSIKPLEGLRKDLEKIGEEIGQKIQIQHENIFKMMTGSKK